MKACCDDAGIEGAARTIRDGGIVVFPTDTVYGIGCSPYDAGAINRIYQIKARDTSKPLPVLVHSMGMAERLAVFDDHSRGVAARFWPGQVTMLLELADHSLRRTMNLQDTIAVRIPDHACATRLLEMCGPLVGTSANMSGKRPATDPGMCDVTGYDMLLDGGSTGGGESTIVDLRGGRTSIVREGAIPGGEITRIS
ncbi:MAG: threonylcarbamoyl-AMP synthase [Nitrosopumilus sp. H13]|nr:MAG: threonylcarbamoyl-AMP synthase [Nitrosopumilus sp. H13]